MGPTVELASPVLVASLPVVPVATPSEGVGCEVAVDEGACAPLAGALLNILGAVPEVVVAPEAGGAELPPPRLGKGDDPEAVVVGVAALAAVVAAPAGGGILAGVDMLGLPKLNKEPPAAEVPVVVPAPAKRLFVEVASETETPAFPPKLKVGAEDAAACELGG